MDYFRRLLEVLQIEKEEDRRIYRQVSANLPVSARRENGMTWYPVAVRGTELGRGDYLEVELERTTHQDILHQLRFGMTAALFSQANAVEDRMEGTISHISGNKLKLTLKTDELPDWIRKGKLGVDAVFDENSYQEMEAALRTAISLNEHKTGSLIRILTGQSKPEFSGLGRKTSNTKLNSQQLLAVSKIMEARYLAIVHGPPGTGKTTTLVQAIVAMIQNDPQQILVTAPSNAAVDLLSEKLSDQGLNVVRIGNPARVNERQLLLTLDARMMAHINNKDIKKLKRQASEFRDMAQKYKRNFGPAEREQRKALFAEARKIMKDVEVTEQYIFDDILTRAQVITATLVGANHYSIRNRKFRTVFIDEAGQALEPACWIPVLKAEKLIMAGDHCQLPPTIKSAEAARELSITLMEKAVKLHPESVVLLEEQYRMNEVIMGFSSKEFYNNRLRAHPSNAHHTVLPGDQPLVFLDTAGCGYEELIETSSISNPEEAAFLVKHLTLFLSTLLTPSTAIPSVAVISPYRHQVELLKEMIQNHGTLTSFDITINTIDSFQGAERDIVYISMTRSNPDNSIGFLSDIRRMNVAMTRARKKLVVIGDSATLSQFSFYSDLISYAQENNGYHSAWEFVE